MATQAVKMEGVEALSNRLEGLKYDVSKKGGRFALRKAAQVVRNQARTNAAQLNDPQTGRSIASNITEKWSSTFNRATGDLMFRVGVAQGAVLPRPGQKPNEGAGGPTPHWRLLEFGTEKMAAHPFMRPAGEQSAQAATEEFISQFNKALDRALKKGGD